MNGKVVGDVARKVKDAHEREGVCLLDLESGELVSDAGVWEQFGTERVVRKRVLSVGKDVRGMLFERQSEIDASAFPLGVWAVYDEEQKVSKFGLARRTR